MLEPAPIRAVSPVGMRLRVPLRIPKQVAAPHTNSFPLLVEPGRYTPTPRREQPLNVLCQTLEVVHTL
jgi:hypothetical protein